MKAVRSNQEPRDIIVDHIPGHDGLVVSLSYKGQASVSAANVLDNVVIPAICEAFSYDRAGRRVVRDARAEHQTDNVRIDDNAVMTTGEDGTWVSAWVYLPKHYE